MAQPDFSLSMMFLASGVPENGFGTLVRLLKEHSMVSGTSISDVRNLEMKISSSVFVPVRSFSYLHSGWNNFIRRGMKKDC